MTNRRWWLLAGSIVALALIASAVGIANGYAYDDRYIVETHDRIHTLAHWWRFFAEPYWPAQWGADGYRPLTLLAFALQWAAGNGAPWVFHLVNVLLYASVTLAVFWLATELLPLPAAWLAGALFAVHPVHVEAVANVVGQAELWVALLVVLAAAFYLRRRNAGAFGARDAAIVGAAFLVACFFKEHAIVLPGLLMLLELMAVRDTRPLRARFVALRPFALVLVLLAAVFLAARTTALEGSINGFRSLAAFRALHVSDTDRRLTMLGLVPTWVRLFLWPAHLRVEYSPPDLPMAEGFDVTLLPGIMLLVAILLLAIALWRRQPVVSAGIAWVCVALFPVSNLLVPTGILIAERTLFLPSVGVVLAVGAAVSAAWPWLVARRMHIATAAALGAAITLGAWKSQDRTRIWHDNMRLLDQAVQDAPRSYRAHYLRAGELLLSKRLAEASHEYRVAVELFPMDPLMTASLAQELFRNGRCPAALPLYALAQRAEPDFANGRFGYAFCLLQMSRFDDARTQALEALRYGAATPADVRAVIRFADSAKVAAGLRPAHRKMPETVQKTTASAAFRSR